MKKALWIEHKMTVLMLNAVILLIYSAMLKQHKKAVTILSGVQLFSILALRSDQYGADAAYYCNGFNLISNYSFSEICSVLSPSLMGTAALPLPYAFENGWVLLNWLVSAMGIDYRGFILITSAITAASFALFAYRYSEDPGLSLFVLSCSLFYLYSFYILRQTLAFCICLFATRFLSEKRPLPFFMSVGVAVMFHRSALLFILLYPFVGIRVTRQILNKSLIVFLISLLISVLVIPIVLPSLLTLMGKGHYIIYFQWNNMMLLQLLIVLCLYLVDLEKLTKNPSNNTAIWGVIISLIAYTFMLNNEILARSIEYIFVFVIVLIPSLLNTLGKHEKVLGTMIASALLLAYLAWQVHGSSLDPYLAGLV